MFQFFYSRAGASWSPDKDTPPTKGFISFVDFKKTNPLKLILTKRCGLNEAKGNKQKNVWP